MSVKKMREKLINAKSYYDNYLLVKCGRFIFSDTGCLGGEYVYSSINCSNRNSMGQTDRPQHWYGP